MGIFLVNHAGKNYPLVRTFFCFPQGISYQRVDVSFIVTLRSTQRNAVTRGFTLEHVLREVLLAKRKQTSHAIPVEEHNHKTGPALHPSTIPPKILPPDLADCGFSTREGMKKVKTFSFGIRVSSLLLSITQCQDWNRPSSHMR